MASTGGPILPTSIKEFELAVILFNTMESWDEAYWEARKQLGKSEGKKSYGEIGEMLLTFANRWACRIPKKGGTSMMIGEWYRKSRTGLDELGRLENLSENDLNRIKLCFSVLCNIKTNNRRVGPTAASKMLHVIKPHVFVAWDNEIAKKYGCDADETGYVKFLTKMKKFNDLIEGWNPREAKLLDSKLGELFGNRIKPHEPTSLLKFIDEYNWVKLTKNVPLSRLNGLLG